MFVELSEGQHCVDAHFYLEQSFFVIGKWGGPRGAEVGDALVTGTQVGRGGAWREREAVAQGSRCVYLALYILPSIAVCHLTLG